jgi:ribosome-associated protein
MAASDSSTARFNPHAGPSEPSEAADGRANQSDELQAIRDRALMAARAALDLKAENVTILDMHELVSYTDFLVICTGRSTRQTRRVSEEIAFRLKAANGLLPARVEGQTVGEWVLMDYVDFIVHVFTPDTREFYRLDVLWKAAPSETVEAPPSAEE